MKVCSKCKTEYPDDMAFCSYCGTPLQSKVHETVCAACGKVIHEKKSRFCPYCGEFLQEKCLNNNLQKHGSEEKRAFTSESIKNNTSARNNNDENLKRNIVRVLKFVLYSIGIILVIAIDKIFPIVVGLGQRFLSPVFVAIVSSIIPAFVVYKYCNFESKKTTILYIFIAQLIVSILSVMGSIPIGSFFTSIVLAIFLYHYHKK